MTWRSVSGGRQDSTPATFPKAFHEEPGRMLSRGRQNHLQAILAYSQDFSNFLESENLICVATAGTKSPLRVLHFGSIVLRHVVSRHLAYTFPGRQRRQMPWSLVHSLLSPFSCTRIITQFANLLLLYQNTRPWQWHTPASQRNLRFKALSSSSRISSQPAAFTALTARMSSTAVMTYSSPNVPHVCPMVWQLLGLKIFEIHSPSSKYLISE